ncbi:MAG TPA: ribonuclease P protein component [Bacteroidia bacterium]|nr:ribonuclease P protein component [Bacteroidia bacterium]
MVKTNRFHKQERLCSKKHIQTLFEKGKGFNRYPIRLIHLETTLDIQFPVQVLFVVPKKQFRKAHDRNLLKRRMKEAFRLQKQELYASLENRKLLLAFVYNSKQQEPYKEIEKGLHQCVKSLLNTNR